MEYPEVEYGDYRKWKKQKEVNDFIYGAFITFCVAAIAFMFFGNWIVSQLMK